MKLRTLALVAGIACLASASHAAIIVQQGILTAPLLDDFSSLTQSNVVLPQTSNGLTVNYVGPYSTLVSSFMGPDRSIGTFFGKGYFDITSNVMLDAFGFSMAQNNGNPNFVFNVNGVVLDGSTVLGTFSMPGIQFLSFTDFAIIATNTSSLFNHVQLSVNIGEQSPTAGFPEIGILDNLRGEPDTFLHVGPPPAGGVPEPATWALMMLGLGAIGAAVRRRTPATA